MGALELGEGEYAVDWMTLFSNLLTAFVWPIVLLILVLIFRKDVSGLIKRATSINFAGTKTEFADNWTAIGDYVTAFGYIESQLSRNAAVTGRDNQDLLAGDIEQLSRELLVLHPLTFGFLVEIGRGVNSCQSWLKHGEHIIRLKECGYIELKPEASKPREIRYRTNDFKNNTIATLTELGDEFLVKLGYTDRHIHGGANG